MESGLNIVSCFFLRQETSLARRPNEKGNSDGQGFPSRKDYMKTGVKHGLCGPLWPEYDFTLLLLYFLQYSLLYAISFV